MRAQSAKAQVVVHNLVALLLLVFAAAWLASTPARAAGQLSGNADFKLLATLGFEQAIDGAHREGTQMNEYAWSMQWFKGKLYVGTARFENDGTIPSFQTMSGQIWAYTPGGRDGSTGTWKLAYQSPMGLVGPRDFGYRWMTICNVNGNDQLFIATAGMLQGNILRTSDGQTYTALSRTGFPAGTVGFRTIVCFTEASGKRLLVTTPVGSGGNGDAATYDTDISDNPVVIATEDPLGNSSWRTYSPMRMGNPNVDALFTLYAQDGWLYAGANDGIRGAQVWRTRGCTSTRGTCAPTWELAMDRGAGRAIDENGQAKNYGISDIMAFNGALYLGLSTPTRSKPPAEMLRLRADGMVEVVIGDPRLNFGPDGNAPPTHPDYPANLRCGVPLEDLDGVGGANDCPPTSRRGGGFGPVGDALGGYPAGTQNYFWRIHNYAYHATNAPLGDNRLYAGTLQGRRAPVGEEGFDIIVSSDGSQWTRIVQDGLGDPHQLGMRSIASTPYGLGIGSANRNLPGNGGGCAVWLAIPGPDSAKPVTQLGPPSPDEGSTIGTRSVGFAWTATDTPGAGSLPLTYACRLEPLEAGFSAFGSATSKAYANLPNGTYTFHVIAKDAAGNTEVAGGAGNRRTFTVDAPDLPPGVAITVAPVGTNTTGNVTFGWTGSDDLTPPASLAYAFWLEPVGTDPGTFVAATSASYTNLADGSYTFRVKARDSGNNVSPEAAASFVVQKPITPPPPPPPPPPPAVPATPSALAVAAVAPGTLRLTWPDVTGETSYEIGRCIVKRNNCNFTALGGALPANATQYDDTSAGTVNTYRYRLRACNSAGCSAWTPGTGDVRAP